VADPAAVHELRDDPAAGGVHGVGHLPPRLDLLQLAHGDRLEELVKGLHHAVRFSVDRVRPKAWATAASALRPRFWLLTR
jgi:hypothetical protein